MNILLQPASGKEARIHFKDTIADGVYLSTLKNMVSGSEYKKILELDADPVQVWGFRPKPNHDRRPEWSDLLPGDLVLFYGQRAFYYMAQVHSKIHNPKLARALWGKDSSGRTWEYMYFIKKGSQVDIPFDPRSLGYSRDRTLIGAILLRGENVEILKKQISKYSNNPLKFPITEKKYERKYDELIPIGNRIPILRDDGGLANYKPSVFESKKAKKLGKIDYEENNRRNSINGSRAEELAFNFEKNYLKSIGREDLAKRIKRVSLESDSLGYDIASFDEHGLEKKIEVKSMVVSRGKEILFYISSKERSVAETSNNYYVYLVRNINKPTSFITCLKNPFKDDSLFLEPTQFRVKGLFR